MSYSPIDKPTNFFNSVLYTGNGNSSRSITGVGFQPDWVWIKSRSDALSHALFDAVRGTTKVLNSNADTAEYTNTDTLTAFGTDGFTVGSNTGVNADGETRVAWNWKAGTSVSGNTTGSGTAKSYSGSVNTTAGFSIIKYTGNGTSGQQIPHDLGVVPQMIIQKRLDPAAGWNVYNYTLGLNYVMLNNSNASASDSGKFNANPTSTYIQIGNDGGMNTNDAQHLFYCFADVKGYSKFGSYTGNGNDDGTFVYTGFKPAFVMSKCTSHAGEDWNINDDKRPGYNVIQNALLPNSSSAEVTASFQAIDTLSNGFKWRGSNDRVNASGKTYIYMAFAESPFVGSNFVPNNAR